MDRRRMPDSRDRHQRSESPVPSQSPLRRPFRGGEVPEEHLGMYR